MIKTTNTALQKHLADGASDLIHAVVTGQTRKAPLPELRKVVDILVEGGALTAMAGLGILAVDARIITEAGRDRGSKV